MEADLWWGLMITTVVEVGLEDEDEEKRCCTYVFVRESREKSDKI